MCMEGEWLLSRNCVREIIGILGSPWQLQLQWGKYTTSVVVWKTQLSPDSGV